MRLRRRLRDEGEGKPVSFPKPTDARSAGIETIYQDLTLANNLDVPADILLGREVKHRHLGGLIDSLNDKLMLAEAEQSLAMLDIQFPNRSRASRVASARPSPSLAPSTGRPG